MCNFCKIDNTVYVNTTDTNLKIKFGNGELIIPSSSDQVLEARSKEVKISNKFYRQVYIGNDNGRKIIERIRSEFGDDEEVIIIGTYETAMAYPGEVAESVLVYNTYNHMDKYPPLIRSDKFIIH